MRALCSHSCLTLQSRRPQQQQKLLLLLHPQQQQQQQQERPLCSRWCALVCMTSGLYQKNTCSVCCCAGGRWAFGGPPFKATMHLLLLLQHELLQQMQHPLQQLLTSVLRSGERVKTLPRRVQQQKAS